MFESANAKSMKFWHGDIVKMGELGSFDYRMVCSKRPRMVLDYVDSSQFEKDISICFVCSTPK